MLDQGFPPREAGSRVRLGTRPAAGINYHGIRYGEPRRPAIPGLCNGYKRWVEARTGLRTQLLSFMPCYNGREGRIPELRRSEGLLHHAVAYVGRLEPCHLGNTVRVLLWRSEYLLYHLDLANNQADIDARMHA